MLLRLVLLASCQLCCLSILAQQIKLTDESQHGTCAIALATESNVALIVDSKLTLIGGLQPCAASHAPGCKAVLVRKDVLLAVTGIYDDRMNGVYWKVSDETQKLLRELPNKLEKSDLDVFGNRWFEAFVRHYASRISSFETGRELSTLLIATRVHGVPYLVKTTITLENGRLKETEDELFISSTPSLFYAGSCRDHVNTHMMGFFASAPDPPNAAEAFELKEIGDRKRVAVSSEQFVSVLQDFEKLFTKIEERENKCWIGPPYDVATWSGGDDGWKTNFKVDCSSPPLHSR